MSEKGPSLEGLYSEHKKTAEELKLKIGGQKKGTMKILKKLRRLAI